MGNMVRMKVTIKGTRPLLQHRFGPDAIPLEKGERTGVAGNDPEEWKRTCMVNSDGQLFIDGRWLWYWLRGQLFQLAIDVPDFAVQLSYGSGITI